MSAPSFTRRAGLIAALCLGLGACKNPPSTDEKVPPPAELDAEERAKLGREAHREALELALEPAAAALAAADPLGAYRAGLGERVDLPLTIADRVELEDTVAAGRTAIDGIDEAQLSGSQVVLLRALHFGLSRIHDDLHRRPALRQDPVAPLTAIAGVLDELRFRLIRGECDAACRALPRALADDVPALRQQLEAASRPAVVTARDRSAVLAARARALAELPAFADEDDPARAGLEELAVALDEHTTWLFDVDAALAKTERSQTWTADPPPLRPGGPESLERLPGPLGRVALRRRLSVGERLDLDLPTDLARVEAHAARWQALAGELLAKEDTLEAALKADAASSGPVDTARCEAALAEIRAGLETVEEVEAPSLDCPRYLEVLGDDPRSDGELTLELLDLGVIEPQRRARAADELPELRLIRGRWSEAVHLHLRRIMLLAHIDHRGARARALLAGRRALCLAGAALWIHGELGGAEEIGAQLGPACELLGEAEAVEATVLGDPRGALAGLGLSLIGDDPAQMAAMDRYYWAPLGLITTLATPPDMHPDAARSSTDAPGALPPPSAPRPLDNLELKIEKL